MHYLKLILVVIAGSLALWLAVLKLVLSTDELAESFTIENYGTDERTKQAEAVADQLDNSAESTRKGGQYTVELVNNEEPPVPIDPDLLIDEDPADDDVTELDVDEEKTDGQNDESALSEKARADSDADMLDDGDNAVETANRNKTSRGKALDLDRQQTVEPKAATIQALYVAYAAPADSNCVSPDGNYPRVGVHYRPTSYAIKGQSLTNIDKLIAQYRKCAGKLFVLKNKIDTDKSDERLIQLRQDEVKYYLLQRRVPKADMIFSEKP